MNRTLVHLIAAIALSQIQHTTDTLDTVKENLTQQKALLVDVREEGEWKQGHLQAAYSVPLSSLEKGADSPELATVLEQQMPKRKILYTHCASGQRSLTAAEHLKKMGYDVRPLKAGYRELVEAGFLKAGK